MKTTKQAGHEIEISYAQLKEQYNRLEKLYNVVYKELENSRQELKLLKGSTSVKGKMKLTYTKPLDSPKV